jgi:hypothetical protein
MLSRGQADQHPLSKSRLKSGKKWKSERSGLMNDALMRNENVIYKYDNIYLCKLNKQSNNLSTVIRRTYTLEMMIYLPSCLVHKLNN